VIADVLLVVEDMVCAWFLNYGRLGTMYAREAGSWNQVRASSNINKKDGITRANPDLEAIFETVYGGDAASLFENLVRSRDIVVSEVADKHAVSHIPQKSLEYHL
jgi:hypothetical protein